MKRIACTLAAISLMALGARADEKEQVEVKKDPNHVSIEKKHTRGHSSDKTKVESKAHHRMGGGTVSTTETTEEHDRPGMGNDSKKKTSRKVERDANGNVVHLEEKVKH